MIFIECYFIYSDALQFAYTLKTASIPAGDLTFRFDVITSSGLAHTTDTRKYQIAIPMVATHISFQGFTHTEAPTYK